MKNKVLPKRILRTSQRNMLWEAGYICDKQQMAFSGGGKDKNMSLEMLGVL